MLSGYRQILPSPIRVKLCHDITELPVRLWWGDVDVVEGGNIIHTAAQPARPAA